MFEGFAAARRWRGRGDAMSGRAIEPGHDLAGEALGETSPVFSGAS